MDWILGGSYHIHLYSFFAKSTEWFPFLEGAQQNLFTLKDLEEPLPLKVDRSRAYYKDKMTHPLYLSQTYKHLTSNQMKYHDKINHTTSPSELT